MQERHLLLTFCPYLSPCPTFEDASFQRGHTPRERGALPFWERVVPLRSPPPKDEAHSPWTGKEQSRSPTFAKER